MTIIIPLQPQRFSIEDPCGCMEKDNDGDYVLYEDFERLAKSFLEVSTVQYNMGKLAGKRDVRKTIGINE